VGGSHARSKSSGKLLTWWYTSRRPRWGVHANGEAYGLVGGVVVSNSHLGLIRVLVNLHRVCGLVCLKCNISVALNLLAS
jgi:hypothetical protein